MRKSQRGFWETDVRTLDLTKPRVLRAYLERKIAVGDWTSLDRRTVLAHLDELNIDPHLRGVLDRCIRIPRRLYAQRPHARPTRHPLRYRRG